MKKKDKKEITIDDINSFFGNKNEYFISAVHSHLDSIPFAHQLGLDLDCTFSRLTQIKPDPREGEACFNLYHASLPSQYNVYCCILENKTTEYQLQFFFTAKGKNKLSFQTGFLYKPDLYLFNKGGLTVFKTDFFNVDYLILFYGENRQQLVDTRERMNQIYSGKVEDVSHYLDKGISKGAKQIEQFLKGSFYFIETTRIQKEREEQLRQFGIYNKIPKENLEDPVLTAVYNDPDYDPNNKKVTITINNDIQSIISDEKEFY